MKSHRGRSDFGSAAVGSAFCRKRVFGIPNDVVAGRAFESVERFPRKSEETNSEETSALSAPPEFCEGLRLGFEDRG